jgi:hypothetical protein
MKRLSHEQARQILQAASDGLVDEDIQAALEKHLAECTECSDYAIQLTQLETRLAASLQERWPLQNATGSDIASVLGKIPNRTRIMNMKNIFLTTVRGLTWIVLAIALVAVLTWGIRNLVPKPAVSPEITSPIPSTPEATQQPTEAPSLPVIIEETSTPQPVIPNSVGLFPNVEFTFPNGFPAYPQQATLYFQKLSEPVNIDAARQTANQLGVNGGVYSMPNEGGDDYIFLEVTDGGKSVTFMNFPDQFIFIPDYSNVLTTGGGSLSYEEQVAIATQFLQERGLLDTPYRTEPIASQPGGVHFVPLLEDRPVIFGIGVNSGGWIDVIVGNDGEVDQVSFSHHNWQPVGEFPILSAQQAWERLSAQNASQRSQYAILSPEKPTTYRSWQRAYPTGEFIHLYNYAYFRQPADAASAPLVTFGSWPISNTPATPPGNPWDFLHAWGQLQEDDQGRVSLNLEGWEVSPFADDYLTGTIQRQGDLGLLVTQYENLILPGLPSDVPEGAQVSVRGVKLPGDPATYEWSYLDTGEMYYSYSFSSSCGGGGGGGGGGEEVPNANFGGGDFSMLNLDQQPTPTPVPLPYSPGEAIEATGTAWIIIHQYAGGRQTTEVNFGPDQDSGLSIDWPYRLEGEVLAGIEQFHNLPVHIWGKFERLDDIYLVITVERFEPVYPGLHIQGWAGTEQIANVDGRDVILFTTTDGQTYVLDASLNWPAQDQLMGIPGDLIGIEGYIIPDMLYGGYAVIKELSGEMPPDDVVSSTEPIIWDESQESGSDPNSILEGRATVENIELAYYAISLDRCTSSFGSDPTQATWLYVQPVWVFSGTFDDGRRFEIRVQALMDEYLK